MRFDSSTRGLVPGLRVYLTAYPDYKIVQRHRPKVALLARPYRDNAVFHLFIPYYKHIWRLLHLRFPYLEAYLLVAQVAFGSYSKPLQVA